MRSGYELPVFTTPLDVAAQRDRIVPTATVKGMFPAAVVGAMEAKSPGSSSSIAPVRFLPFRDYPLREYVDLLAFAAPVAFPNATLREGLRRLGWGAHFALRQTIVGKVLLELAKEGDVVALLGAASQGYALSQSTGSAEVIEVDTNEAIVKLTDVPYFLDCHHVGVFEGMLRHSKRSGQVGMKLLSPTSAELCVTWDPTASS